MKLTNVASTRLTDEEAAFLRQLADQEERRPADVLRRLVIAAKKQRQAPTVSQAVGPGVFAPTNP